MNENFEEQQNSLKKYVLGNLGDDVELRRIEEMIMLDDDFAEQLSIAEDELIDDYLDGTLTAPEREQFLQFFLRSPENREKLRLIENLRKYAAKQTPRRKLNDLLIKTPLHSIGKNYFLRRNCNLR